MPTVLICDDVDQMRALIRRALRSDSDMEIVGEATDGQQAVDMAAGLHPDIVMWDLQMPVKDGLEALQESRRDSPECKIVIFTGLTEYAAAKVCEGMGADDY